MSLTEAEILRYSRHIILPEVGGRGQRRLKESSVLIAGLGPTGSAAALYLAAAGISRIALWDPALVTEADLQGAIAHDRSRLGLNRAQSAQVPLQAINPDARVDLVAGEQALLGAVAAHGVVLATAGDWGGLQAAAAAAEKPVVFAATHGASGALFVAQPGTPDLTCAQAALGDALAPESGEALAAASGVMGVAAATEVVKLILTIGTALTGRALLYDGWDATFQEKAIRPCLP